MDIKEFKTFSATPKITDEHMSHYRYIQTGWDSLSLEQKWNTFGSDCTN